MFAKAQLSVKRLFKKRRPLVEHIFIVLLVSLLFVFPNPVYAQEADVSVASHWVGAFQEYDIAYVHPTPVGVSDHSGTGQGFRPTINGYYLTGVVVQMKKSGSPTGALHARLVTLDAQSATAEVTDTILANSTNYIISSNLTTSYVNYTFTFDQTYQLNNSLYYGFVIVGYNASFTLANKVQVNADRYSASNNYADGVSQYYNYAQWSKELQFALYFDVFANEEPDLPPEPPPEPEPFFISTYAWIGIAGLVCSFMGVLLPAWKYSNEGLLSEETLKWVAYGGLLLLIGYGLICVWLYGGF